MKYFESSIRRRSLTAIALVASLALATYGSGDSKPSALPQVIVVNDDPANMVRNSASEPLCFGITAEVISPAELRVRPLLERPVADAGKVALLISTNIGEGTTVPYTAQGDSIVLPMPGPGERLGVTTNVEDFSGSPELPSLERLSQSPNPFAFAVPSIACAGSVVTVRQR